MRRRKKTAVKAKSRTASKSKMYKKKPASTRKTFRKSKPKKKGKG
jgi:hypothetical protein